MREEKAVAGYATALFFIKNGLTELLKLAVYACGKLSDFLIFCKYSVGVMPTYFLKSTVR